MKLLSFVIFFAVFYEIHSVSRVCGPSLVQLLDMVCVDGFNGMGFSKNKRSSNKQVSHDLDALTVFNEIEDESPFKSDSLLNDMLFSERLNTLAKTRRHRHVTGVHDECCLKPCTMQELSGYCL